MSSKTRALALKIHLTLGLTAGAVIAVLCLTGVLLSFEAEITQARFPERYATAGGAAPASLGTIVDSVHAAAPEARIGSVTMYKDLTHPWMVNLGRDGQAFVDGASGHVIASGVRRAGFFQTAMELHRWLLADEIGAQITGGATVLFVVLLLAGIVIWWPRTKGALKARINPLAVFSSHGGGRRKLHDLHVALGIWCWPILLMVALSGLPEAYDWAGKALYTFTGSSRPLPPPPSTSDSTLPTMGLTEAGTLAWQTFPEARMVSVRLPMRGNGALAVSGVPMDASSDRHADQAYFDRVSGQLLRMDRYTELPTGARARRMVEPWHTGAAWGLTGKIIIFLAVLLGASFPVTGILMYRAGKRASVS